MAKKRQNDFQRTHLKVGRPPGKRRNITATSFKSKQLVVHNKAPKPKTKRSITDILSRIKSSSNSTSIKVGALQELHDFIREKPTEHLRQNLCEVLDSVLTLTVDTDDKVKDLCVGILVTTFEKTEDIQLLNYVPRIALTITCLMKHSSHHSKLLSLSLLDGILVHHSALVVHSSFMDVLCCLRDQAGCSPLRKHSHMSSHSGGAAAPVGSERVYSQKFQINVLGYINAFLQELLRNMTAEDEEREVPEVYFHGKEPMHWPIFLARGAKPRYDPERSRLNGLGLRGPDLDTPEVVNFIEEFVNLARMVFIEEMPCELNRSDNILSRDTIKNLNILFDAFCKVCQWAQLLSYTNADAVIRKFLVERIFNGKTFPFESSGPIGGGSFHSTEDEDYTPRRLHEKSRMPVGRPPLTPKSVSMTPKSVPACTRLNITLCYLCVEYLIQPGRDNETYNNEIFSYLKMILSKNSTILSDTKCECIPLILKIMKIYLNMTNEPEVSEFLNACLKQFCCLLRSDETKSDHLMKLVSFLMEICVDPVNHSFISESDGMKPFFNWLLKEIQTKNCRLDKKHLRKIKIIANRKYPAFLSVLNSLTIPAFKGILTHNNEEVRDAGVMLIYHVDEISESFFRTLTDLILKDKNFPNKDAIHLIRLIKCRFFDKPTDEKSRRNSVYSDIGFVNFTLFLINVAIDKFSMENTKYEDFDNNQFAAALKPSRNIYPYDIIPNVQWKDHDDLFDVCYKCLKQLPADPVSELIMRSVKKLMDSCSTLPTHSVIAIMLLDHEDMMTNEDYRLKIYDLTFSCLMTLSVLTVVDPDDVWYQYCINQLEDAMNLSRNKALQILDFVQRDDEEDYEGIVIYHFMRIINFFVTQGLMLQDDTDRLLNLLEFFKETCKERSIDRQPLFQELFELLSSY